MFSGSQNEPVLNKCVKTEEEIKMIREERKRIRDEKRQAAYERQLEITAPPAKITVQPPIWNEKPPSSSLMKNEPLSNGVVLRKIPSWIQITEFIDGTIKRRWRNAWDLITTSARRMGEKSKKNRNFAMFIVYQKNTDQFKELFRLYDIDAEVEDVIQSLEKIRVIEADAIAKKTISANYKMDPYIANLAIAMLSATIFTSHKTIVFHTKIFNESRYDASSYQKYWELNRED